MKQWRWLEEVVLRRSRILKVDVFIVEGRYMFAAVYARCLGLSWDTLVMDTVEVNPFEGAVFNKAHPNAQVTTKRCALRMEFLEIAREHPVLKRYKFTWKRIDDRLREIKKRSH